MYVFDANMTVANCRQIQQYLKFERKMLKNRKVITVLSEFLDSHAHAHAVSCEIERQLVQANRMIDQ